MLTAVLHSQVYAQSQRPAHTYSTEAETMQPLIPLELEHAKTSLARYVMQYHSEQVRALSSLTEFQQLATEFESLAPSAPTEVNVVKNRLTLALSLKYYMDRLGVIGVHTLPQQLQMSSAATARLYRQVSRTIYSDSTFLQKKTLAKALYQYYRMSAAPWDARTMAGLKKILTDQSAPPALKVRVYLHLLHFEAFADEVVMNLGKLKAVEQKYYSRVRGISLQAYVFADLTMAAAYAGVKDGLKLREQTHPQYSEYLKRVVGKLDRLPRNMRTQVTKEVLLIWQLASGGAPSSYLHLPISIAQLGGTPYYEPILERYALSRYRHSLRGAAKPSATQARALLRPLEFTYRKLLRRKAVRAYHGQFLVRLLQRHQLIYQQTNDYSTYEKQIHWQLTELKRADLRVDKSQHLAKLHADYRRLVDEQIARTTKASPEPYRRATISLVDRFIKIIKVPTTELVGLYESQAQIYVMSANYLAAVRTYLKTEQLVPEPVEKIRLLDQAIQYQSVLARWPSTPVWSQPLPQVVSAHLTPLSYLYEKKLQVMAADQMGLALDRWHDVTQLGLIYRHLNQDLRAADLFATTLKRSDNYAHAAILPAAFLAMVTYESSKKWQQLEELGVLMKQQQLTPRLGTAVINVDNKIAMALALGGRALLKQKQFANSVSKLARFLQLYEVHPLTARVRFDYAQALWGSREFSAGLSQLEVIARDHPQFVGYKSSLELGLDWSMNIAHEKAILFFIQAYTARYHDRRSFDLRLKAINLLHHLGTFKDSYANIQKLKASPFITPALIVQLDLNLLDLLEQSGSQQDIAHITTLIINRSKDTKVLAQAYEMQMNLALARGDKLRLGVIEKSLVQLGTHSPDIKEVIAMSRLHQLVLTQPAFLDHQVHNISLKDPLAYLRNTLGIYTKLSQQYLELCTLSSSTCVAAMGYLQTITRRMRTHIADVKINPEYDQKVQQEFINFKSYTERVFQRNLARSSQVATAVSQQRGGLPVMIQRMLWLEGKDWNFDPLSSGSGSGFVSWYMKDLNQVE